MGDAHFQENSRLCLTFTSSSPPPSSSIGVGRAIYRHPILFRNISSKSTASFLCKFTFTITPNFISVPPLFGDGFTFIITSKSNTLGEGFGFMGLSNQSNKEHGMYIAVEFDTRFDHNLGDISDNHIGIDVNSVFTYPTMDSTPLGFDLKNGKRTTVWIGYQDEEKVLNVWLIYNDSRNSRPTLAARMDLSIYINELMFETRVKGGRLEKDGDVSSSSFEVGLVVMLLVTAALLVKLISSMGLVLRSAIYKLVHQSANQTASSLTTNTPVVAAKNPTKKVDGKKNKARRDDKPRLPAAAPAPRTYSEKEAEIMAFRIREAKRVAEMTTSLSKGTTDNARDKYLGLLEKMPKLP
ncbi:L-type lectin-domain containing receptor kinase S.6-like [Papaver somniferum]|uniref:L-type lectin-domain containing receptor kinase S.6-like n=1 Tax=Papaver somniferum TaxID=3469 RepID=UPI000E6FC6A7|nr:L-type lectin-domain containing receptor kinase S.6-like [Papaver somniferum]